MKQRLHGEGAPTLLPALSSVTNHDHRHRIPCAASIRPPARGSHPCPSQRSGLARDGARLCSPGRRTANNLGWEDALGRTRRPPLPDGVGFGLCIAELKRVLLDSFGAQGQLRARRPAATLTHVAWLGRPRGRAGSRRRRSTPPWPYEVPAFCRRRTSIRRRAPRTAGPSLRSGSRTLIGVLEAARQRLAQRSRVAPVRAGRIISISPTLSRLWCGRSTGIGFEPVDDYSTIPISMGRPLPRPNGRFAAPALRSFVAREGFRRGGRRPRIGSLPQRIKGRRVANSCNLGGRYGDHPNQP